MSFWRIRSFPGVARPGRLNPPGFLAIMVVLLTILVSPAPAANPSPYPKFIKGDNFFIPGRPLVGYLTVQPRFTAIEHDRRNNIVKDFFGWRPWTRFDTKFLSLSPPHYFLGRFRGKPLPIFSLN